MKKILLLNSRSRLTWKRYRFYETYKLQYRIKIFNLFYIWKTVASDIVMASSSAYLTTASILSRLRMIRIENQSYIKTKNKPVWEYVR